MRFPEELWHNVFTQLIDIPTDEELFDERSDEHNWGARWQTTKEDERIESRRPPSLLLVCKAWQRICTPILYRTVILRQTGQADALAATLARRSDIAPYIKRLRLHGAYGYSTHSIMRKATQLSLLFLQFCLRSVDNISGLVSGLQLSQVNPRHLFLTEGGLPTKFRTKCMETLVGVLGKWTNLQTVHLLFQSGWNMGEDKDRLSLFLVLQSCRSLRRVHMSGINDVVYIKAIRELAQNRSLETIHFLRKHNGKPSHNPDGVTYDYSLDEAIAADERLHALCVYETHDGQMERVEVQQPTCSKAESPRYVAPARSYPMQSQSMDVQEKIWALVFTVYTATAYIGWPHLNELPTYPTRLMLVCKLWRRVLLPHVYGHLICTNSARTRGLAELFPHRPDLGALVRELTLRNETFEKTYIPLGGIIQNVPNLRVLNGSDYDHVTDEGHRVGDPGTLTLRWAEFAALARAAPNLEEIRDIKVGKEYTESRNPAAPPATGKGKRAQAHGKELTVPVGALSPFRSLRVLRFDAPVKLAFTDSAVPKDMFLALEELQLYSCHTSLLKLLILCEMPHLRILGMYGRSLACRDADDFLKKHGKNIEELNLKTLPGGDIFRSCEKVKKLRIEEKKPPLGFSTRGWASRTLESVFFVSELSQLKPSNRPWMPVLLDLDAGKLPALKTIYMRIRWPSGEFDTKKDFWVPLAEELLKKGIKLRDARHGLSWIPRVGLHSSLKW